MKRPHVHLVDDDETVRSTLARLLVSGGYEVSQYASGTELLERASQLKSGCILLDIKMPEPDGFAVQRQLANKGVQLPVIMMTGSGDLMLLALKAGVSDFIQKPFGKNELLGILQQISSGGQDA